MNTSENLPYSVVHLVTINDYIFSLHSVNLWWSEVILHVQREVQSKVADTVLGFASAFCTIGLNF